LWCRLCSMLAHTRCEPFDLGLPNLQDCSLKINQSQVLCFKTLPNRLRHWELPRDHIAASSLVSESLPLGSLHPGLHTPNRAHKAWRVTALPNVQSSVWDKSHERPKQHRATKRAQQFLSNWPQRIEDIQTTSERAENTIMHCLTVGICSE
jgi:hypothetical protein